MAKRTDVHRKGAIVPADYKYLFSYQLGDMAVNRPSHGIDCRNDRAKYEFIEKTRTVERVADGQHSTTGCCCVTGLKQIAKVAFAEYGEIGKCSVCGAVFVYGDVWQHIPSGEHIHIGHECATKYGLLADRSESELAAGRAEAARGAELAKKANYENRLKYFSEHPGLEEALSLDHYILKSLSEKLVKWHSLSDAQMALAFKIAEEIRNPKVAEVEAKVSAPVGEERQTVQGTIVSIKTYENPRFGPSTKMTVKVKAEGGVWLAWGTVPAGIRANVGNEVKFQARLSAGRDPYFALFSRPTQAQILETVTAS